MSPSAFKQGGLCVAPNEMNVGRSVFTDLRYVTVVVDHFPLSFYWNRKNNGWQGDQIGPSFAISAIIYLGRLNENNMSSPNFCLFFVLNVTKYVLGHILGNISSTHLVTLQPF
jgi:hypothetical protein